MVKQTWIRFALPVFLLFSSVAPSASATEDAPTHAQAAAEGAHDGHGDLNFADFSNEASHPLVALLFNFIALVIIVYLLMRKPLGTRFKDRKAALVKALEEAEAAKKAAEAAMETARAKMGAVDSEMEKIRAAIRSAGTREAAQIVAAAEAGAERIGRDAQMLAAQEIARMAEAIRKDIVERIVNEASDIMGEKINPSDRDNLTSGYLKQLGSEAQRASAGKSEGVSR